MLALVLAATLSANPPLTSWSKTFSDNSVADHFPSFTSHALVIVNKEATRAVEALRERVRKGEGGDLVQAPADFANPLLDDAALARSAKRFGAGRIAIVRLYGGSSLLVAIYNEEGAPLGSFAATEGVAYAHPGVVDPAIEPVLEGAVREVVREERVRKELEAQMVGFSEMTYVQRGAKVGSELFPLQGLGKKQKYLSWPEFYRVIGRDDLQAYVRAREGQRTTLYLLAAGAALGGVAIGALSAMAAASNTTRSADEFPVAWVAIPAGLATGAVLGLVGASIQTDAASRLEVRQYAADYNATLLRRGPAERKKKKKAEAASSTGFQLAFTAGPAGLGVFGVF